DELLNNADVGLLCVALEQGAHTLLAAGIANDWVAGSVRWEVEIATDAVQSGGIGEVGELDLPGGLGRGLARQSEADGTVFGDGDSLRLRRNSDLWNDGVTAARNQVAVAIQLKIAGARVCQGAGRLADLEEALALDHDVEWIVCLGEIALREDDFV